MKEKDLQRAFGKWLKENWKDTPGYNSAVFELKIEKQTRMLFNKVKDHQIQGLRDANIGLYHKISDSPIFPGQQTRFTAPKPFDCMYLRGCDAYVVVMFYVPRAPKYIYIFHIDDYEKMKEDWPLKSFSAREIDRILDNFIKENTALPNTLKVDITHYFRPTPKKRGDEE